MGTDEVEHIDAEVSEAKAENKPRERSTIEFPYSDLGSAVELARMIDNRAGNECEVTQLAAWMGQSAKGGTFRSRYSAARLFGFIETARGGHVKLTTLGSDVLNPEKSDMAKAQAFLKVELFRNMYDARKGQALPPAAALERMVTNLGVAPKQAERARQTFVKSAQVAKFFDSESGVFIQPAFRPTDNPDPWEPPAQPDPESKKGGGDGKLPPELDPIIKGLIDRLPDAGSLWPSKERELWLQILQSAFELVYKDEKAPDAIENRKITEGSEESGS